MPAPKAKGKAKAKAKAAAKAAVGTQAEGEDFLSSRVSQKEDRKVVYHYCSGKRNICILYVYDMYVYIIYIYVDIYEY